MPPPDQPDPPVDVRLLRAEDLLVARLTAPGCTLRAGADGPQLLAGPDASVVLHLPPQHLGEQARPVGQAGGGTSGHRAAGPTRLVFAVAEGTTIPFALDDVLAALRTLPLRVAALATPAPAQTDSQPTWTDTVLAPGWRERVPGDTVRLGDLLSGTDDDDTPAAAVRRHARAARLLRGASGPLLDALRRGGVDDRLPPLPRPSRRRPRPPTDAETSIEAPYRLQVSPSVLGAFTHAVQPVRAPEDTARTELWRTRLSVRVAGTDSGFLRTDDGDDAQRAVRALWTRDLDAADEAATEDPPDLHPQSLRPRHRRGIVRQTSDPRLPAPGPLPLRVRTLALSSLGAWIDWAGSWGPPDVPASTAPDTAVLAQYRHQAVMGRDSYVRVAEPGWLHPFGHRALWVTVTERKIVDRSDAVALLWQREFIVVRQPTRRYPGHDNPWAEVTLEPLITPDLDPAPGLADPFVPTRGGQPYDFTLVTTDRAGRAATFSAPLVFISNQSVGGADADLLALRVADVYAGHDRIPGRGQQVALATEATAGDTALEVDHLVFRGEVDATALTSRPSLVRVNAVVPAMRHLSPQAPGVDLAYSAPFLAADRDGFGAGNPGQLFMTLAGPPPAVDFSGGSDRSGGFLAPNLVVRALSRTLGAVGENGSAPGGLSSGTFDPRTFLDGALPRLFGLFRLLDVLDALGVGLDDAPTFVTEALDTVSAIVSEAERLRRAAQDAGPRLAREVAAAAHGGARDTLTAAAAQVDAAIGPLLTALGHLQDSVGALVGTGDVQAVVDALTGTATAADALLTAVSAPQVPMAVRSALQRPAQALSMLARAEETLAAVEAFVDSVLSPGTGVTARFEWRPRIHSWPEPPDDPVLVARDDRGLSLAVEVRAGAAGPPSVDVAAEIADFALQLMPSAPLMALSFSRIGFRVSSGSKPEVDVVFGGIEFLGALSFVDTLRRMIPFDGFADPPYVDVSPEGAVAGFDLALPNLAIGVFSLENIALGADARLPFLGDAVTVGFHFCSKESPFRLTVMMVGGGGWVELRASPKGLVLLEVGLEAAASLSVDLGVASGSVSISVGVYLRLEAEKGLLTAYFRIRGEVDVLGLVSASITLELSLTYHFQTGKLVGRASLVVEIEVLFFSASVEIVVERQLAGSKGDPVLADVLPPAPDGTNADWSAYCEAFAPLP